MSFEYKAQNKKRKNMEVKNVMYARELKIFIEKGRENRKRISKTTKEKAEGTLSFFKSAIFRNAIVE